MTPEPSGRLSELLVAVRTVNPSDVAMVLAKQPALASATVPSHPAENDPDGTTLLHWAMPGDGRKLTDEHVEVARLLLESGADPNAIGNGPNHGRCGPISLAAWGNHVPLIRLLLEHGAKPDGVGEGRTPIRTAAEHNHVSAVCELISAGATYSLYELVLAGLEKEVGQYLDEHPGAVVDVREGDLPTLHVALTTSVGVKLVPLLLEKGADPKQLDERGRNALHVAIDLERVSAIAALRPIVDLDIFAAAGLGEEGRVRELIDSDASCVRAEQGDGATALYYAVLSGSEQITKTLLESGSIPSPRSTRHWACITPLHLAIMRREIELVRLLLDNGADVDAFGDGDGYFPTPLHVAARWGGEVYVAALIHQGADPLTGGRVKNSGSPGVLGWVAYAGKTEILSVLVENGLDATSSDCIGVLHLAAARGHLSLVEQLLHLGVSASQLDHEGKTALDRAIEQGQNATADLLRPVN